MYDQVQVLLNVSDRNIELARASFRRRDQVAGKRQMTQAASLKRQAENLLRSYLS